MKIAIHQSQYIPWPPYFKKIATADIFVVMDNVQFQKNGVQNRNKVRNKEADFWLTVPVKGQLTDTIQDKEISNDQWKSKHWKSIQASYRNSPNWGLYEAEIYDLYSREYSTLHEANNAFFHFFLKKLDITTRIVYLSELKVEGVKSDLVLDICRSLDAEVYLSGWGSRDYLNEESFEAEGIRIRYQESVAPVYQQFHGSFIQGLSTMDMLLNVNQDELQQYFHSK